MIYYLTDRVLNKPSAKLRVTGPDANTYLQGQFSQDLRVPVGNSAYGLWLDSKGRIKADSQTIRVGESEFLVVSASMEGSELKVHLEANLIADDVAVTDESESWRVLSVWGEESIPVPPAGWHYPSRRAGANAREWILPAEHVPPAIAALDARGREASLVEAERARIGAAIPAVPADLGPRDFPQEGGLDETAVSYTKGCYLGQEVMARIHNLGQVRRRLHVVQGPLPAPAPGAPLFRGETKLGEMRSSADNAGGFIGMAMLSLLHLSPGKPLSPVAGDNGSIHILRRV